MSLSQTPTTPYAAALTDPAPASAPSPAVVLFDVNETLSDMAPMATRFADVGASPSLAATWFASVLRDGFALTAAGTSAPFAVVGAEVLRTLLPADGLDRSLDEAVEHVMAGFAELPVHPDVPEGLRTLATTGRRLVTLSNGSASVAEGLLKRAGVASVPGAAAVGGGRRGVEARTRRRTRTPPPSAAWSRGS